jgi:hypothetical protein
MLTTTASWNGCTSARPSRGRIFSSRGATPAVSARPSHTQCWAAARSPTSIPSSTSPTSCPDSRAACASRKSRRSCRRLGSRAPAPLTYGPAAVNRHATAIRRTLTHEVERRARDHDASQFIKAAPNGHPIWWHTFVWSIHVAMRRAAFNRSNRPTKRRTGGRTVMGRRHRIRARTETRLAAPSPPMVAARSREP